MQRLRSILEFLLVAGVVVGYYAVMPWVRRQQGWPKWGSGRRR
jgi:hypothetical protein